MWFRSLQGRRGLIRSSRLHKGDHFTVYGKFGGTSAAAPYITGVIALMLEADASLQSSQIEAIFKSTAREGGPSGYDTGWGWGEVGALAAVLAALA